MNSPAKERVYQSIRNMIAKGEIAGGTFIEELDVSNKLGVSRTPVREAFLRLEAERFIDLIPRRGAFVRQITAHELINVYEARRLIEVHAAKRFCEDHNCPLPEGLDDILDKMQQAIRQKDYFTHIQLDMEFHRHLVATTHNEVLLEMYDRLQGRKLPVAHAAFKTDPARANILMIQHQALLAAFVARDAQRAENVLNEHLRPISGILAALPT